MTREHYRNPYRPTVPEAVPWIEAFLRQPGNEAGGVLHIVLDDHNYKDEAVTYCLEAARLEMDVGAELLASGLLAMSSTQRRKAIETAHKRLRSGGTE